MRHLAAEVGASQLVIGTDFPYPWTKTEVDLILQTPGLSDADTHGHPRRHRRQVAGNQELGEAGNAGPPAGIYSGRSLAHTMSSQPTAVASLAGLDDGTLAARIAQGDHVAFEALMRRHNGRFFRVARAILKDDGEAEDALQDAYLDAYRHMGDFRGEAQVSTWLTRIVANQALMRLRRRKRDRVVVPFRRARSE